MTYKGREKDVIAARKDWEGQDRRHIGMLCGPNALLGLARRTRKERVPLNQE